MKAFLVKIGLAAFPLAGVLIFSFLVLWRSGEFLSAHEIIRRQQETKKVVLTGLSYSSRNVYFKAQAALARHPAILVLGTSRVLGISAAFFKNTDFYNAGLMTAKIRYLRYFLASVPRGMEPKILLVGLDQNYFNSRWDDFSPDDMQENFSQGVRWAQIHEKCWGRVFKDYLKKKFSLKDVFRPRQDATRIGLNALANNNGFRNDGSYYYGTYASDPAHPQNEDKDFSRSLDNIARGVDRFEVNAVVSPEALKELKAFLQECKARNIYVIGFLPPFAHAVYERLKAMEGKYHYLFSLGHTLKPLFQEQYFGFHDFSDITDFGSSDSEAIDGLHVSEKCYVRLCLAMFKNEERILPFTDLDYLRNRLARAPSDYFVFGFEECFPIAHRES